MCLNDNKHALIRYQQKKKNICSKVIKYLTNGTSRVDTRLRRVNQQVNIRLVNVASTSLTKTVKNTTKQVNKQIRIQTHTCINRIEKTNWLFRSYLVMSPNDLPDLMPKQTTKC